MKKVLVSAILGLAAIASVQAQSTIRLYNYGTPSSGSIVYGAGAQGSTGLGQGIAGNYTIGIYFAVGDVSSAANTLIGGATTQGGANTGTLVGSGLTLSTTANSTSVIGGGAFAPGDYGNEFGAVLSGVSGTTTVTVVLVAYNGATYESSLFRGHSAAFTMTANAVPTFPLLTGDFASGFAVAAVPEPSTFALAGLGLASLLIFRRRK